MNYQHRIEEAKAHETENVSFLSGLSDGKLERKLNIVREQMVIAEKNKQTDAVELLKIWEGQIIEARVLKHEQPERNELSEIEMELKEMEIFEAALEQRQKALTEFQNEPTPEASSPEPENEPTGETNRKPPSADQLKLF